MTEQAILDNAPKGATHYSAGLDQYWDWPTRTIKPVDNTLLEDLSYPDDLRSLSDIKRIAYLESDLRKSEMIHKAQNEAIDSLNDRIAELEAQLQAAQPELIELQNTVYEDVCNTLDEIMVVHHMTLNYSDPRKSINELLNIVSDIAKYFTEQKSQPEVCMDNLRHCILMALNDCLIAEVGPGHSVVKVDGEVLYNRVRGILDAITPLPAPPEKGQ
jgi:hypothetical protein